MKRDLLLLSTTTIHGSSFLEYCLDEVVDHFSDQKEILFVPYARPSGISHDEYTELVKSKLASRNIVVKGIHEYTNPSKALRDFGGIYIGGGNTFLLLKELYHQHLIEAIRSAVFVDGMKYMGSSAGTNVACKTINNTNDMPVVYPPSFDAIGLIPFNINPHYLDPDPHSKHKGETRETRINEFHFQSEIPVLGLREGSWLRIMDNEIELKGRLTARLFQRGRDAVELNPGDDLTFLLD